MSETSDRLAVAVYAHAADVLRYLQRRSPADAHDLLGQTLLVAWQRALDAPATADEMRPWLYGIARMTLRGHRRDELRRLHLTERVATVAHVPEDTDSALLLDVRSAIVALPDAQRELVELVHWEGLAISEAAAVLGINASTARSRYAKARETLAVTLASASTAAD